MPPKQAAQRKEWMFTIYAGNLTTPGDTLDAWELRMRSAVPAGVNYLVFQQETCPTTQRVHVQGFVGMSQKKRPAPLGTLFDVQHTVFQSTNNGTASQNRGYCTDNDKRLAAHNFFEHGEMPGKRKRTDIHDFTEYLEKHGLDAATDMHPTFVLRYPKGSQTLDLHYSRKRAKIDRVDIFVAVYCGPTDTGKSWAAQHFDEEHCFTLPDQAKGGVTWFDGYKGQDTLIIDEYDGSIPYRSLLRFLDHYPLEVQTKGGFVPAEWCHVILTTNDPPSTWYPMQRGDDWTTGAFKAANPGPLERRINLIIDFAGKYPNTTYSSNGNPIAEVLNLAEILALAEQAETTAEAPVRTASSESDELSEAHSTGGHSPPPQPQYEDHTLIDESIQEMLSGLPDTQRPEDRAYDTMGATFLDDSEMQGELYVPATQRTGIPPAWLDEEAGEDIVW